MKVFVTTYEHRYGRDVNVFYSEAAVTRYKDAIAETWWEIEFPEDERPDTGIGDAYFKRMADRGEFFTVDECELTD